MANTGRADEKFVIINGLATPPANLEYSGGRAKKFACTWPGCSKLYTRPSRLDEHIRSHTGEKPFKCTECESVFGRESHLKAHARTHLGDEEKKHACEECDKKFWTGQHLKKHVLINHRGMTFDCKECDEKFRKHNLLRAHVAMEHSEAGTLPFPCTICTKSFKFNYKLQAHLVTHDDSRYVCGHPSCLELALEERQFPTWSTLQQHTKLVHPPTCSACLKKFTTSRGLKNHSCKALKRSCPDGDMERERKRRRVSGLSTTSTGSIKEKYEERTPFVCVQDGCKKRYASGIALERHVNSKHTCDALEPATTTKSKASGIPSTAKTTIPDSEEKSEGYSLMDLLTGSNYLTTASQKARIYPCIAHLLPTSPSASQPINTLSTYRECAYKFTRLYDLERHLNSAHAFAISRRDILEMVDSTCNS